MTARQCTASLPLGIVIRRAPGVTRWAQWTWRVVAVLPGAGPADWRELRTEDGAVEYHATTLPLELWETDTEAYLTGLSARAPAVYVVLTEADDPGSEHEIDVLLVTASPYEAQDYMDSGEEIVEQVPMPEGLVAFVRDFVERHHEEEIFVKRRRDEGVVADTAPGKGDVRIRQMTDVYRRPDQIRPEVLH